MRGGEPPSATEKIHRGTNLGTWDGEGRTPERGSVINRKGGEEKVIPGEGWGGTL